MKADRSLEIGRAARALRAQVELVRRTSGADVQRLKQCVTTLTKLVRGTGAPPERALMSVKHAAFPVGGWPKTLLRSVDANGQPRDMVERLVRWCIDAYFRADAVTPIGARAATSLVGGHNS